jgi:uncharacterized OB-fold protein
MPAVLSSGGKIETWTTVHRAPPGFEAPYVLAWVALDEGLRVLARCDPDGEVGTGTPVEVAVRVDGERPLIMATTAGRTG